MKLYVSLIKMYLAQKALHARVEKIFVGHKLIIIYAMFYMHVYCASNVLLITFKGKNTDAVENAQEKEKE